MNIRETKCNLRNVFDLNSQLIVSLTRVMLVTPKLYIV